MYSRSESLVFSLPTNAFFQPQSQSQFDFRPMMPRNTEPEIFTFEQPAFPPRGAAVRPRKRNTRVMYPSKVRKYLPPAEKSPAKRWLLVLCLVVFMQIYTEEESVENTQSEGPTFTDATSFNVLPFQSAEDQVREVMGSCPEDFSLMSHQQLQSSSEEKKENFWLLNTTCPSSSWEEDINTFYQQSRRNGYVMALLYPVYHRLGTENWMNSESSFVFFLEKKTGSCGTQVVPGERDEWRMKWWKTQAEETSNGLDWQRNFIMEWNLNGSFRFTWKCFSWSVASQVDLL